MAKCKLCKTNIPDGAQYCKDCQDKEKVKANESYLDSLLNSVKNTPSPTESIYKRNNVKTNIEKKEEDTIDFDEFDFYRVDMSDIDEFETFNIADDLEDSQSNILIDDEDLFGEKLSNLFEKETENNDEDDLKAQIENLVKNAENESNDNKIEEEDNTIIRNIDPQATTENIKIKSELQNTNSNEKIKSESQSTNSNKKNIDSSAMEFSKQEPNISGSNTNTNELLDFQEDFNIDPDLNDLLNSLDSSDDISMTSFEEEFPENSIHEKDLLNDRVISDKEPVDNSVGEKERISEGIEETEFYQTEDDDFMSLLSQISYDDPVAADVKEISELLSGNKVPTEAKGSTPSNVGEVFSNALKAVSNLKDDEYDEESILNQISDNKNKKGKKSKKDKKGKKNNESENNLPDNSKKSFLQRIFGNVADENATKKTTNAKKASSGKSEEVNKKSKKVVKGKKGKETEVEDEDNPQKTGKEKEISKKDKKAEKAEKKKKTKDVIQVIDEIEDDEGRINRLGAFIVFVFFGLLVVLIISGANVVSYSLSIQHATNYFGQQKYTQAYNEVYGMDIKDEDIEIYDKIKTVMFVNKQLNSYNNFFALEKYPEALDSLLKGLQRYEKYIELATMLGIKTDLDYVRSQILAELDNQFNLSEEEAIALIHYENMDEYSLKVYDVVLENMND